MDIIEGYLNQYEDRFWLFHPERPFYQVAGLDQGTTYTAAKMNGVMSESSNKLRLFPQRAGISKESLFYAEAARWLLYVNAFDDTSAKPTRDKGRVEKLPSPGAGWLGKIGIVTAVGDNLFEALLLNLVLLPDGEDRLWGAEKPSWELANARSKERTEIAMPNNLAELYTLQSRRLLLQREGDLVTGYMLLGGDFFQRENAFTEQMTGWNYGKAQGESVEKYRPRRHDSSRQLWRDFPVLVMQTEGKRRPGIVGWLARLKSERRIPRSLYRFRIVSVQYGDKDFFVDDVFSDSLSLNASLLTELGNVWANRIIEEIGYTEKLVDRLGNLARDLAKAAGDSDDTRLQGERDAARQQAYYRLDEPFRRWLEAIDPEKGTEDIDAVCDLWWEEAKRIVRALATELVEQAGAKALVGRELTEKVKGKETKRRYTSPEVHGYFLRRTANRQALKGAELA